MKRIFVFLLCCFAVAMSSSAGGEGLLENEGKITGRSDNTLVLEQGSVFETVSGQIE